MPPKLLNKTAVVTGGSRGIGRAVVEQLLQEGARVVAVARSVDQLAELEERSSPRLLTFPADVTRAPDLDRLVEFTQRRIRHVDILCPLAGSLFGADPLTTPASVMLDYLQRNSLSAWETLQKFRPLLTKKSAVCFATAAPVFEQLAGFETFAASKALLGSQVRSTTKLNEKFRVNAVACAPVETPGWRRTDLEPYVEHRRWNRLTPGEVAETILFLVSDEARALRGTELVLAAVHRR